MTAEEAASGASDIVDVRLLGGFEVSRNGQPVVFDKPVQRLVAFVALRRHPMSRHFICSHLWPDVSENRSSASLRTAIWRARHAPVPVLTVNRNTVDLSPHAVVDTSEMSKTAHQIISQSADELALNRFSHALARCEEELLPDWYDDWVILERERLRHMVLHALEALVALFTEKARYAEAIDAGLRAVGMEPLRESAQRALINAYLAEGNRSEALRQYASYDRVLRRDMGLSPTDDLDRLIRSMR